ncbi:hypothetical protein SAMN02910292_02487 [Lachnospiraceae bacterium XBB2008]|nr:hypothetical protein SAMN02910292_02487 [Lachnospiraceae bacterium XBB2008]
MDPFHNNKDNIELTEYCIDCRWHEYFPTEADPYTHEYCYFWGKRWLL